MNVSTRRDPELCAFFWRAILPVHKGLIGRICRCRMTFQVRRQPKPVAARLRDAFIRCI